MQCTSICMHCLSYMPIYFELHECEDVARSKEEYWSRCHTRESPQALLAIINLTKNLSAKRSWPCMLYSFSALACSAA